MSFSVFASVNFKKEFKRLRKKYPSAVKDLYYLTDSLEKNPFQGKSLGKGCYKIRLTLSSKGKGKSGGARVIIQVRIIDNEVYLVSIYDKSEKESISITELEQLLSELPD